MPMMRVETVEAQFGGVECEGEGYTEQECNSHPCPGMPSWNIKALMYKIDKKYNICFINWSFFKCMFLQSTIQQFCLILQYIINFARKMVFVLFLSKTKSVTFASWAEKCLYSFPQFSHKHKPLFCKCLVFSKLMKVLLKIPLIRLVVFQLRKIGLQTKFRKFGFHSYLQAISIIIIWRNDLRIR